MSTNAADLRPITTFWWLFVLFGVVTLGVGVSWKRFGSGKPQQSAPAL